MLPPFFLGNDAFGTKDLTMLQILKKVPFFSRKQLNFSVLWLRKFIFFSLLQFHLGEICRFFRKGKERSLAALLERKKSISISCLWHFASSREGGGGGHNRTALPFPLSPFYKFYYRPPPFPLEPGLPFRRAVFEAERNKRLFCVANWRGRRGGGV